MRYAAVLLFVALRTTPCVAQYSQDYQACNDKANTQAAINVCASDEASAPTMS